MDLGGPSYRQLLIVSVLSLFLELLMIRWVSSEVRIFAYFKNFVLIACFLGLGFGCYLSRRAISLLAFLAPLALLSLFVSPPWAPMRKLMAMLPNMLGTGAGVHIWGVPSLSLGLSSIPNMIVALLISAILFLLIGFLFIPVGQMVGWYLENAQHGITGYTLNVLASVFGIVLYTVLCFWYQPPPVWFAGVALLFGLLLRKQRRLAILAVSAIALCALVAAPIHMPDTSVYWSPYQKLTLTAHPTVLVLGAGMGNDVAAALRNTSAAVTAVEIDPLILQLGRELHFEHPYASQRVRVVVDDARNYIQNTPDRFDLIVFSLLDSHTTSSFYSNIRIDNYVYTVEALAAARKLLSLDGVFIIKFQAETPWIVGRLERLLETVFQTTPLCVQGRETKWSTGGELLHRWICGAHPAGDGGSGTCGIH